MKPVFCWEQAMWSVLGKVCDGLRNWVTKRRSLGIWHVRKVHSISNAVTL